MTHEIPISPKATARLVVTMPPQPSRLGTALADDIASVYVTLMPTTDEFWHIAWLARERPEKCWAGETDLFATTQRVTGLVNSGRRNFFAAPPTPRRCHTA